MVVFFEEGLLAPEVIVKDDLLLEVVKHHVADAVRVLDLIGKSLVSSLEVIQNVGVQVQICFAENELAFSWVVYLVL